MIIIIEKSKIIKRDYTIDIRNQTQPHTDLTDLCHNYYRIVFRLFRPLVLLSTCGWNELQTRWM